MAVKMCPKCNEDNGSTSTVCINCGSSLRDCEVIGNINVPNYSFFGKEKSNGTILCPKCKEKLPANTRNCKYCGEFIAKANNNTYSKVYSSKSIQPYSSNASILLYIATLLIPIVGLIVGGVYTASDNEYKQEFGRALLKFGLIMILIVMISGVLLASCS